MRSNPSCAATRTSVNRPGERDPTPYPPATSFGRVSAGPTGPTSDAATGGTGGSGLALAASVAAEPAAPSPRAAAAQPAASSTPATQIQRCRARTAVDPIVAPRSPDRQVPAW